MTIDSIPFPKILTGATYAAVFAFSEASLIQDTSIPQALNASHKKALLGWPLMVYL